MKDELNCPYKDSGICYHKSCIYLPHQNCMKKREFDKIMAYAKKKNIIKNKGKGWKKKNERKGNDNK